MRQPRTVLTLQIAYGNHWTRTLLQRPGLGATTSWLLALSTSVGLLLVQNSPGNAIWYKNIHKHALVPELGYYTLQLPCYGYCTGSRAPYPKIDNLVDTLMAQLSMLVRRYHADILLSAVLSRDIAFSKSCMEAA